MNALTQTLSDAASLTRKELAATFRSPVAAIFLGVFLVAVNLGFFTLSGFFARGLADVRPLFEWLPLLLLLLVSALTMRAWAEERKMGTLELLLTLPVRPWSLVLGKFAAGVTLVALGLALTWPLPGVVAFLGPLDWGPVIGGYLGALLVGAAYVALGLCISSVTDNQVVALILTLVWGAFLYLIGHEAVTALVSTDLSEWLVLLGTGSRFESIERGVIDLRDVVYYAGLTVTLLALNVTLLVVRRIDRSADPSRLAQRWLHVGLVGVNALLLLAWLTPIPGLRLDLTADGLYSVSPVTRQTLRDLEEPLYIDGYFSSRSHPLLQPLIPQIRDTLSELEEVSGGRVTVDFADPALDDDLAAEIGEAYGIESVPFGVADRNSQSLVNAYFHILLRYGDRHRVLQLEDLIEFDADVTGQDMDVRLGDLEYTLTRGIRKLSQDFQSLDAQLARLPEGSRATLYTTPDTLPDGFDESVGHLRTVASDLAERSGGRLTFEEVTPDADQAQDLAERYGVRPLAADLFGRRTFYAHLVLEAGDQVQRLMPGSASTEGDVRRSVEAAIRRAVPGQLKQIGLVTATPEAPPPNPNLPPQFQPPPPRPDYQALQKILAEGYEVESLDLSDGDVPDHVDVLIVSKAGELDDKARWAIDQYLMRGGAVLAMTGAYKVDVQGREGLQVIEADDDLHELLASWGVTVEDELVLDPQNAPFPMPVQERRGGYVLERVELLPYPFFPDIRRDGMATQHAAVAGLTNVTTPWASPLTVADDLPEDVDSQVVLRSSSQAWTQSDSDIQPDMARFPDKGFGPPADAKRGQQALAVTLTGPMKSYFADKDSPMWEEDPAEAAAAGDTDAGEPDRTGRTLRRAAPEARLAVIGTSEFASDVLVQLADGITGEVHRGNIQAVQNLLDWSVEDTDLLAIRSAGAFARTLPTTEPAEQRILELSAYAGGLIPLVFLGVLPLVWRRRLPPRLAALDRAKEDA